MISKKIKIVYLSIILVLLGAITYVLLKNTSEKNAWVDVKKIYNEFSLKQELEKKYKQVETERKNILDSLELDLNLIARELNKTKPSNEQIKAFEMQKETYLYKKQQFTQENEQTQQTYNEQILTQLNQYVKDYCKEKNYDFVFGADGNGSLMYSKETKEITADVIVYINNKYKGVK